MFKVVNRDPLQYLVPKPNDINGKAPELVHCGPGSSSSTH